MSRALCFTLVALVAPGSALAETARGPGSSASSWYAAVSGGQGSVDGDELVARELPVAVVPDSMRVSSDSGSSAGRIAFGYRFNPVVAVEGSATTYGRTRIDSSFTVMRGVAAKVLLEPGTLSIDRKASAIGADLVLSWPVMEKLSVTGRAGVSVVQVKTEATTTVEATIGSGPFFSDGQGGLTRSGKTNDTVGRYGVGLEWAFARDLGARLEFEHLNAAGTSFRDGGGTPTGRATTELWSAGLVWRF